MNVLTAGRRIRGVESLSIGDHSGFVQLSRTPSHTALGGDNSVFPARTLPEAEQNPWPVGPDTSGLPYLPTA